MGELLLDAPAEGALEVELGTVVIGDGADVLAAGLVEGLDGLQGFDGQALAIADTFGAAAVGVLGGGDAGLG